MRSQCYHDVPLITQVFSIQISGVYSIISLTSAPGDVLKHLALCVKVQCVLFLLQIYITALYTHIYLFIKLLEFISENIFEKIIYKHLLYNCLYNF